MCLQAGEGGCSCLPRYLIPHVYGREQLSLASWLMAWLIKGLVQSQQQLPPARSSKNGSLPLAKAHDTLLAFTQQDYESGRVHELVMQNKFTSWNQHKAHGDYRSGKWRSWEKWRNGPGKRGPVKCKDGLAIVEHGNPNQTFQCKDMDLYDFKSHADLGSFTGEGSSSWGWTSDDGREFVAGER
ncbi:hypothetical protein K431DRAFT_20770 [Polychaeton citri CBS 116435]|uniref:Uncharacterized protein n=1 Tax=Polychaeton citri CBS 116435 TaxID=1314669 RepID=A0A9P4Q1F0_9PEZI|nr:hypothetical protein K431DRAFT_20770 [Polychaeton citri CBS 116435]